MNAGDFLEANARIAGMWLLPSPQVHDDLIEAIETDLPDALREIAEGFGWDDDALDELADGERTAWDEFFEQMIGMGKQGWLVKVDVPVYEPREGSSGMSYSWGYYQTNVLFAETVTDALQKALDWANAQYDNAKTKAAA